MPMPYSHNPRLPHVRMQAVRLHQRGWSARAIGRHLGYHHTAVMRWVRTAAQRPHHLRTIPTASSAPKTHPNAVAPTIVAAILAERARHRRCAEVVHQTLLEQGYQVSLSSVYRTLKRHHLLRERSPWKRRHDPTPRPVAAKPGDLVQVDTIHVVRVGRFYVYTLLDVYSRWAHAAVSLRIRTHDSLRFVRTAQDVAPFAFSLLQSDHGSEFSTYFTEQVQIGHRHSRVRTPNDNAHLERFNRTVQEECLDAVPPDPRQYQAALDEYLPYYNTERKHLSLDFKTPWQWCQGAD